MANPPRRTPRKSKVCRPASNVLTGSCEDAGPLLDGLSYGRRSTQGGHGVGVVAELGEYLAGVLADLGDRGHDRLRAVHGRRRQEGPQRADRGSHLPPPAPGFELGMVEKALDRPHPGVGYLRSVEALYGLLGGKPSKDAFDLPVQDVPVLDAPEVAGEAFVPGQGGLPQHDLAEPLPLPLVLDAEEDHLPVAALEGAVGGDGGVARPGPRRLFATVQGEVGGEPHPLAEGLEERDLEGDAFAGAPAPQ